MDGAEGDSINILIGSQKSRNCRNKNTDEMNISPGKEVSNIR